MVRRCAAAVAAGSLFLWIAACGSGGGGDDGEVGGDVGVDTGSDVGTDTVEGQDTVGGDADTGGDGDADVDDGCGPVEDPPNTDIDRDRDGLPDECDNYKFLNHGGDNPTDVEVIQERPDKISNDTAQEGEAYDAEPPFIFDGSAGPVEDGEGDLDYVSFRVDEPTALLIRMEAKTEEIWPGTATFGYDPTNTNLQYLQISAEQGSDSVRGMFLPVPGRYSIAVSDVRSLLNDLDDVGSENNHTYRMRVSKVPLPEIESTSVPDSKSKEYDNRIHVHQIDASALDGLELRATGTATGNRAFLNPAVALYDEDEDRSLSYTLARQVDPDTRRVNLKTKLNGVDGDILVIEDETAEYAPPGESTSRKLEFSETTVDSEFETLQEPQDERSSDLVWMQSGDTVSGTIGDPRSSGPADLTADEDYYLVSTRKGMAVEITVEPTSGSQLQPSIGYGILREFRGRTRFRDRFGHTAPPASSVGESRTIQFVHTSESEGEYAIQVVHGPNGSNDTPAGGSNYGYDISVKKWEVGAVDVGSLPGSADVSVDPGSSGVVKFTSSNGGLYRIVPTVPDSVSFDLLDRAIRTTDWELLRSSDQALEVSAKSGTEYWYDFRDEDGRGTGGNDVTVEIQELNPTELSNLPDSGSGSLSESDPAEYYKFQASEGDRMDLRLWVENRSVSPRFRVYDLETLEGIVAGGSSEVFEIPEDGEYLVKIDVQRRGSSAYEFGAQKVQPDSIGSLPKTVSATLDDRPFPKWYEFDVEGDKIYEANLTETGSGSFNEEMEVFDAESLEMLSDGDGVTRFRAPSDGTVLLAVYDRNQGGDPNYQFDLDVRQLEEDSVSIGQTVNGQLGDGADSVLYTFDAGAPGAVEIDVEANGTWTPTVRLLSQSDFKQVEDIETYRGTLRYASAEDESYAALVGARDGSRTGPLDFTVSADLRAASSTVSEQEPNDAASDAQKLSSFPAVVGGDLGNSGDSEDIYELDLQAEQRVWALAVPQDSTDRRSIYPDLDLFDTDGTDVASDFGDGYAYFPALYAESVLSSGTWRISLNDVNFRSADYYLYVYRSAAATVSEAEPNDMQGTAQDLRADIGPVDQPTIISASVDGSDSTDVYEIQLSRDLDALEMFLENASPGHNLRLLDSSYSELAASGPAHGGSSNPSIDHGPLTAGTYYVELGQGNGGGSVDLILAPSP